MIRNKTIRSDFCEVLNVFDTNCVNEELQRNEL